VKLKLKLFRAVRNCIDLDYNMLVAIEVQNCVEKNPQMWIMSFPLKKDRKTWGEYSIRKFSF